MPSRSAGVSPKLANDDVIALSLKLPIDSIVDACKARRRAYVDHGRVQLPRFFFDADDGERQVPDEAGVELATMADVAVTTRDLLCNLCRVGLASGVDRVISAVVRDEQGGTVYRGSVVIRMSLDGAL